MEISEREAHGVSTFLIEGRVDTEGSVDLDLALQAAVADGKYKLILDMARVSYISSAGLRILADILTQNKANGGDLKLASVSRKVLRVLQIIGFTNFFNLYDTVEQAQLAFE